MSAVISFKFASLVFCLVLAVSRACGTVDVPQQLIALLCALMTFNALYEVVK